MYPFTRAIPIPRHLNVQEMEKEQQQQKFLMIPRILTSSKLNLEVIPHSNAIRNQLKKNTSEIKGEKTCAMIFQADFS